MYSAWHYTHTAAHFLITSKKKKNFNLVLAKKISIAAMQEHRFNTFLTVMPSIRNTCVLQCLCVNCLIWLKFHYIIELWNENWKCCDEDGARGRERARDDIAKISAHCYFARLCGNGYLASRFYIYQAVCINVADLIAYISPLIGAMSGKWKISRFRTVAFSHI